MRRPKLNASLPQSVVSNPKYRGKHLIMVGGKVFLASTGTQAAKLFDRLTKEYPHQKRTLAYIPKEESLILWF